MSGFVRVISPYQDSVLVSVRQDGCAPVVGYDSKLGRHRDIVGRKPEPDCRTSVGVTGVRLPSASALVTISP